jgi:hypothetical protein
MGLVGRELLEDGVAGRVAEAMVLGVDPEISADDRVVADQPPEAALDEVVELVIERAGLGGSLWAGKDDVLERFRQWVSLGRGSGSLAVRT